MNDDTAIIIGGGRLQVPMIREAVKRKLKVAVVDGSRSAPGMALADFPVHVSYRDVEAVIDALDQLPVRRGYRCVLTAGTDATLTVASIAHYFGLPGLPRETAQVLTSKRRIRELLLSLDLPSPEFRSARTLEEACRAARCIGYPLVVKPTDNMGARGVLLVSEEAELNVCINEAFSHSRSGEVVLERFMTGAELSADVLISAGQVHVLPPADRFIVRKGTGKRRFIEMGHALPSLLPGSIIEKITSQVSSIATALGIAFGVIKLDLLVRQQEVVVVEMAGRLSGGRNSAVTIPLHCGVNATACALRLALGEPLTEEDTTPTRCDGVVKRILLPPPGKVMEITGVDEVRSWSGIYDVYTGVSIGGQVPVVRSNVDRVYHVIAHGKTRSEAESLADRAVQTIRVRTVTT